MSFIIFLGKENETFPEIHQPLKLIFHHLSHTMPEGLASDKQYLPLPAVKKESSITSIMIFKKSSSLQLWQQMLEYWDTESCVQASLMQQALRLSHGWVFHSKPNVIKLSM
jgi:hypothetical protein